MSYDNGVPILAILLWLYVTALCGQNQRAAYIVGQVRMHRARALNNESGA